MMENIVVEVGEDNVVQVVTNNATNYKVAGQMLMAKKEAYSGHLVLHNVLT